MKKLLIFLVSALIMSCVINASEFDDYDAFLSQLNTGSYSCVADDELYTIKSYKGSDGHAVLWSELVNMSDNAILVDSEYQKLTADSKKSFCNDIISIADAMNRDGKVSDTTFDSIKSELSSESGIGINILGSTNKIVESKGFYGVDYTWLVVVLCMCFVFGIFVGRRNSDK